MQYRKTEIFSNISTAASLPKVGQWVTNDFGQRGQYLGKTTAGVIVIRYQQSDGQKFSKRDALNNATLRAFAKNYGAL